MRLRISRCVWHLSSYDCTAQRVCSQTPCFRPLQNFQSQRWQTLIHFNTQRRLLLTGTPLQNSLMELWSLLHFLMPYIFRSRKQFSYWFANPMNNIIEGSGNQNDGVVSRLHGIIRPFVLRRLKKDVEAQLPGKFEHVVKCQLSRRQVRLPLGRVYRFAT
jgi:SNF2 family DNA or RNA helicase